MLRKHIGEGHASQQGFGNLNSADGSSGKAAGSRSGKNSSKKAKGRKRETKHRRSIEPVRFALKVTPPTIILEFKDKSKGDKLYLRQFMIKKLKFDSSVDRVTKHLQRKCKEFLSPHLVETDQLKRLVKRLIDHQRKPSIDAQTDEKIVDRETKPAEETDPEVNDVKQETVATSDGELSQDRSSDALSNIKTDTNTNFNVSCVSSGGDKAVVVTKNDTQLEEDQKETSQNWKRFRKKPTRIGRGSERKPTSCSIAFFACQH